MDQLRAALTQQGFVQLSCEKQGHKSKGAALAHVRSLHRLRTDKKTPELLVPFQCPRCLLWHVGHLREAF